MGGRRGRRPSRQITASLEYSPQAVSACAVPHGVEKVPDLVQVFPAGPRFNPGTHIHRVGAGVSDSLRNVFRCEAPGQDERVLSGKRRGQAPVPGLAAPSGQPLSRTLSQESPDLIPGGVTEGGAAIGEKRLDDRNSLVLQFFHQFLRLLTVQLYGTQAAMFNFCENFTECVVDEHPNAPNRCRQSAANLLCLVIRNKPGARWVEYAADGIRPQFRTGQ